MAEEGISSTANKMIHIGKPIVMNDEWFHAKLMQLEQASYIEADKIREMVAEIVPTYHYGEDVSTEHQKNAVACR